MSHNDQQSTDPEPPLTLQSNPPTTRTVPRPMRPGSDPGMPPEAEPEQDDRQWQAHGQGSAANFGPFQDRPLPPKGKNFES